MSTKVALLESRHEPVRRSVLASRGLEDRLTMSSHAQADESVPVLIAGGSMVGLSMAAFLAWHGVHSLAVERHGGTAIHPRAAHFHLRTLEVFRAMGLEDEVRRKSEEQYDSDGGISAVESLAGNEIAKYIPSLNA